MEESKDFVLLEKPEEHLKILEILKTRLPKSALIYNVVQLILRGVLGNDFKMLAFGGELQEPEKVFICVKLELEHPKMILSSPPETITPDMVRAYEEIVRTQVPPIFLNVPDSLWTHVESFFMALNPGGENLKATVDPCTFVVKLPDDNDEGPKRDTLSSEYVQKPLELSDVDTVLQYWIPSGPPERFHFVSDGIRSVASSGIFLKSDPDDQNKSSPACFGIGSLLGTINCLHTMEEHRRKGLAILVVQAIAQRLREQNLFPAAHIVDGNEQSYQLFINKLGFSPVDRQRFVYFMNQQ